MAENQDFQSTVEELFRGMNGFISSKTVVGEAIHVGDTIILPLVDVSFGMGAGSNEGDKKNTNAAGGAGGKMTPSAVLVISNGTTKLVNVKGQDGLSRLIDMLPDVVNRFTGRNTGSGTQTETREENTESEKSE